MTELTLTLIKLAFLAVLWLFVIAAVGVIRSDLFGSKTRAPKPARQKQPKQPKQPGGPKRPKQPKVPVRSRGPARLLVTQGPLTGTTIELGDVPIIIGRGNDASLIVQDDYASNRHARLFSQGGQWFVEDLGSTNGTYLGRNRVGRPEPVSIGVPIRIGKTVIELRT